MMNRKLFALLCILSVVGFAAALEVDQKEIAPGAGDTVNFINYSGPHDTVSTAAEISGIGAALGRSLRGSTQAGDPARYSVIHAVDSAVKTGFDADIFIIGAGAGVDHIDNIRRVIAGYLSAAYGYTDKDAATLATYVTVYNAVYRGKMATFTERYKPAVTANLTADKVGLALSYEQWPGKTQIVIPLSDPRLAGTISAIDTTSLTDKGVVDKMKEDGSAAIDTRKDMADLKEREGDAAQARAEQSQEAAAQARTDAATKQADAAVADKAATQAAKDASQAKTAAAAAQAKADANPTDAQAQSQAQAAQAKADASQKQADAAATDAAAKKADAAQASEAVAQNEASAKADQTLADTKQSEAKAERKDIAQDVQKDLNAQDAAASEAARTASAGASPSVALRVVDETDFLSELVLVNLNDGSTLKTSTLNAVRNRTFFDTGSGLIAIAGKKGGGGAIRLVVIDPNTLEVLAQGKDSIAPQSAFAENGNDYYAVVESSGSYAIGRFDRNAELKAKSPVAIHPATAIVVTDKGLLVQSASGAIVLLRASDLTQITR